MEDLSTNTYISNRVSFLHEYFVQIIVYLDSMSGPQVGDVDFFLNHHVAQSGCIFSKSSQA